ncbi:hypothetical protein GOBAR_AA09755 [Gossypium barbadense]|uniref:Uncharacterized protein n=1 Tax=Gossypium barbadense TaxID=3634 RepID=A0A2P5Y5N4_GOSBA|nr:hypothetical protein GOBAR_AA09755 [Gossypium barbadense]
MAVNQTAVLRWGSEIEEMAVNQTPALKVGFCLLAFHGRISSLQPHFQHLPTLPLRLLFSASSHNP